MKKLKLRGVNVSIKWKIFSYLLLFCILLLVILWFFQTVFLDSFYKRIKTVEVEQEASMMIAYAVDEDWTTLQNMIAARRDLYVEVWRINGLPSFSSSRYPVGMQANLSPVEKANLYEQTLEEGGKFTKKYKVSLNFPGMPPTNNSRETIVHTEIFTSSGGEESMLIVSTEITPLDATVQTIRIQLIIVSGIMVVLAVVIAFLMSKRVSKPIVQINRAAKSLGKGNYEVNFKAQGYREIEELSDTLNHTAKELAKNETLRQELIANTSHDLRTPLTLITGYSEMMRDFPEEANAENLQVIADESKRLTNLVNDLLNISKIQAGVDEMRQEYFCLTDELLGIVDRFSKLSANTCAGIKVEYNEAVYVYGDSARLNQVVYNFLANAVCHSESGQEIHVTQTVEGDRVKVSVIDHGKGIAADALPHLWDRYYRSDDARQETGSGLGLYIAKSILDNHKGATYGVKSKEGEGSTFWFCLEIAEN